MENLPMRAARAAVFMLGPAAAIAHTGEPLAPHDLWTAWRFDPGVVIPLVLAALLYGRGARRRRGVPLWRMTCFWAGWTALVICLVSPVHPLGEALFSVHMLQHEALMLVAAPLMVLARPMVPFLWGLPRPWRGAVGRISQAGWLRRTWRTLTDPLTAWWIHAAALWLWHAPLLFQATLDSEAAHAAQHFSFLFSALLFWWSLFYARGRLGYGAAVVYVFTTAVHTSILGALLTFARTLWYPEYAERVQSWGWTALEDQQMGGLIMWVPAGLVYTAFALALFAAWMRESDALLARGWNAD